LKKLEEREEKKAKNEEYKKIYSLIGDKDIVRESKEELLEEYEKIKEYENKLSGEIAKNAEIVFADEHICNDNLKVKGKDEFLVEASEIIEENEKKGISLK
jgi:hypothetical protein